MPRQTRILVPERSLYALIRSLNATKLTSSWQAECIGDLIVARRDDLVILISPHWTAHADCMSVDVRVNIEAGLVHFVPINFSELLPAYPNMCWSGKEGIWKGHSQLAPGFDPSLVPVRGALIGHLAYMIALAQCWIEHGLQAEDLEAQECAKAAMVVAGLYCGEDVDETEVSPADT